jgi:hypothetical protein
MIVQPTSRLLLRPAYETLAAMLAPAEREILEALGEIIALDLLRQQDREGPRGNGFETGCANPPRGHEC